MAEPLGRHHPLVKRARRLRSRTGRQAERAFLAEGLRVVLTALERAAPIEALLVCRERLSSPAAVAAVERAAAAGIAVHALTELAMDSLSERDHPTGLVALVALERPDLAVLTPATGALYVALDDVADPGNLGTVLRTLDAVGADGLLLSGQGTDPFHPAAVKASLGALWTVPWAHVAQVAEVIGWAKRQGLATVATSARGGDSLWSAALPQRVVVLMGSERHGLPDDVVAAADQRLTIPMWGEVTSLNLAVATGLVVYEVRRRQGAARAGG